MMLQAVGAATDLSSGGRQMPMHWGSTSLHIVSTSSSTTTQLLHAVGCAEAGRYFSRHPEAAAKAEGDYRAFRDVSFNGDEVVLTCPGEGSTSQGEFWEAINTASNQKLPVIFCVEDNGYAISVPVEVNTPGGNISKLVANFPNFHFAEIDGTDAEVCFREFEAAAAHCRAGLGPAFVHGHCVRHYSHSLSDDDRLYRSTAEREADALRDPIAKMQMRLLREGILTEAQINELEQAQDHLAAGLLSARCRRHCPRLKTLRSMFTRKISIRRDRHSITSMRGRRAEQVEARPGVPRAAIRGPWRT